LGRKINIGVTIDLLIWWFVFAITSLKSIHASYHIVNTTHKSSLSPDSKSTPTHVQSKLYIQYIAHCKALICWMLTWSSLPINQCLTMKARGYIFWLPLCEFSALNASIKSEKSSWTSRCHTKGFKIISKNLWIVTFVLGSQIYIDKCDEIAMC
jgi:hypothetical protein